MNSLIYSVPLIRMITARGMTLQEFLMCSLPERFTQEEIDDLEYMEDKLNIYCEDFLIQ